MRFSSVSGREAAESEPGSDVAAAQTFGPRDPVDRGVGAFAGGGEIGAKSRDAEHAATIGEHSVTIAAGAGVEDLDLRVGGRGGEAGGSGVRDG